MKPDGSLAGYDEAGELIIKTPSVALGYANNAEACVGFAFELMLMVSSCTCAAGRMKRLLTGMPRFNTK